MTTPRDADADDSPAQGGDPACWSHLVCPACGRVPPGEQASICAACGAELRDD